MLTATKEIRYLQLLRQEAAERVSPKLDKAFQSGKPIVIIQGGRGAGAKSWSIASHIVQLCQYETHRVACLREVQLTIAESVHQLIVDTIFRLGYQSDWIVTIDRI